MTETVTRIVLGSQIKDPITGFKGTAVAKYIYMTGCTRISVQPKVDKDGKIPEPGTFDESTLEIVSLPKKPMARSTADDGGPPLYRDPGKG